MPRPFAAAGLGIAIVVGIANAALAGQEPVAKYVPWSRLPPGGRDPASVVQLVAVTFDDNFGLADPRSVGGVNAIVEFYRDKHNPPGEGKPDDFDGAPIRTTFFDTSIYMTDSSERVFGGKFGQDEDGRNRAAWQAALDAGNELADHTVNHFNGGSGAGKGDCCRPRNWSVGQWAAEIEACRTSLASLFKDRSLALREVTGFRAPYLGYTNNLYSALTKLRFTYDSSIPNCFDDVEDGTNCSWPYQLDRGSPDATAYGKKSAKLDLPPSPPPPVLRSHPGLWEVPPTTLIVPPDDAAAHYGFAPGLRQRIAARLPKAYASTYEPATGKIIGMDYALLIDAAVTGDEMRAILEYNLDLHLSGNHAPLIFVAHSHLYAFSTPENNPDTPTAAVRESRWQGLTAFLAYALSKPAVRIVAADDVVRWMTKASTK